MTVTGTYSCTCEGQVVHDPMCYLFAFSYSTWPLGYYPSCSCSYTGLHNLPYHLWRRWWPGGSWKRTTWG